MYVICIIYSLKWENQDIEDKLHIQACQWDIVDR